jgi:hypothetical protein
MGLGRTEAGGPLGEQVFDKRPRAPTRWSWKEGGYFVAKELFVEKRQDEGDFAVRKPGSERASKTAPTQASAIDAASAMSPKATVFAERVRHTDRGNPDKWRVVYKPKR